MTKKPKRMKKPIPGEKVLLKALPPGFTDDLPSEDQQAISEVLGKAVMLRGYETERLVDD